MSTMQLFCRVAFGEPRRMSISINRITELEALGILWLELRAGAAVEKESKGRLMSFWIAHGCLNVVWPAQYARDFHRIRNHSIRFKEAFYHPRTLEQSKVMLTALRILFPFMGFFTRSHL